LRRVRPKVVSELMHRERGVFVARIGTAVPSEICVAIDASEYARQIVRRVVPRAPEVGNAPHGNRDEQDANDPNGTSRTPPRQPPGAARGERKRGSGLDEILGEATAPVDSDGEAGRRDPEYGQPDSGVLQSQQ